MLRSSFGAGYLSRSVHLSNSGDNDVTDDLVVPTRSNRRALFQSTRLSQSSAFMDAFGDNQEHHVMLRQLNAAASELFWITDASLVTFSLLRIPHILAQCNRAVAHLLAFHAMSMATPDGYTATMFVALDTVARCAVDAIRTYIPTILSDHIGAQLVIIIVVGIMLPSAWYTRNQFLFDCGVSLCELIRDSGPSTVLSCFVPDLGDPSCFIADQGMVLLGVLFSRLGLPRDLHLPSLETMMDEIERTDLLTLTDLPYGSTTREQLHARRPRILPKSLCGLGRNAKLFKLFFASPSRAPLAFPPLDDRETLNDPRLMGVNIDYAVARKYLAQNDTGTDDYCGSGRTALRALAPGIENIPLSVLPLCAISALMADVWHNKDRFVTANFFMDLGGDIEDIGSFFESRLASDTGNDGARRLHHAKSHLQRYQMQIDRKMQRGYMPILTARCETFADTNRLDANQTFRCPFVAPFGKSNEEELRKVLVHTECNEADIETIVKHARHGDSQAGCLAYYNATKTRDAYPRTKPITNPVFYVYNKALATRHLPPPPPSHSF